MATRGSYVHKPMAKLGGGAFKKQKQNAFFSKYWMVSHKMIHKVLEYIKLYKQNQLEIFFFFTIYQNYALALSLVISTEYMIT